MDSHVERIKSLFAARKPEGIPPLDGDAGEQMEVHAAEFQEVGDCVVVAGSIRTRREEGSLTDSQVTWIYRFEDEELGSAKAFPGRLNDEEIAEHCREMANA